MWDYLGRAVIQHDDKIIYESWRREIAQYRSQNKITPSTELTFTMLSRLSIAFTGNFLIHCSNQSKIRRLNHLVSKGLVNKVQTKPFCAQTFAYVVKRTPHSNFN